MNRSGTWRNEKAASIVQTDKAFTPAVQPARFHRGKTASPAGRQSDGFFGRLRAVRPAAAARRQVEGKHNPVRHGANQQPVALEWNARGSDRRRRVAFETGKAGQALTPADRSVDRVERQEIGPVVGPS